MQTRHRQIVTHNVVRKGRAQMLMRNLERVQVYLYIVSVLIQKPGTLVVVVLVECSPYVEHRQVEHTG